MMKSKKIMKRLFGILMSIVMMMGMMATTAFAAGTAKITITAPENASLKDMEVKAYKVLNQVNPDESLAEKKQYSVTTDFMPFFDINNVKTAFNGTDVYLKYDASAKHLTASNSESQSLGTIHITANTALDTSYPAADLIGRITEVDNLATFYTWIEKYIEDSPSISASTTVTVDGQDSDPQTEGVQFEIGNLDEGYYALIFSNVPDGISVKQGILIATPGTINLKAEPITVTKQVSEDDGDSYHDAVSAAMDTVLKYKITSKVPTIEDYSNLTNFSFTDTYEHQHLVQEEDKDFLLKIGSKEYQLTGNQFVNTGEIIATLDTTTKSGEFTVDFDESVLSKYQGETIELTYYARLTSDAVKVNNNTIALDYTNNGSSSHQTDSTEVYTYGIDVKKTFSSSNKPYSDVIFGLSSDKDGRNKIALVGDNGIYHVSAANDTTATKEDLKLSTDGKLTITGLDEGTYWLIETNAPNGYTAADPIQIVLTGDSNGNLKEGDTTAKFNGTTEIDGASLDNNALSVAVLKFDVFNQSGFELPQTGGAGTWMLTIGGIILIAAAAGLFVASRRKAFSK